MAVQEVVALEILRRANREGGLLKRMATNGGNRGHDVIRAVLPRKTRQSAASTDSNRHTISPPSAGLPWLAS